MKWGDQKKIAKKANLSQAYLSEILSGKKRRLSWCLAKRLAEATGTDPILWVDGSPEEIRREVEKNQDVPCSTSPFQPMPE